MNDLWKFDVVLGQWSWESGNSLYDQKGFFGTKFISSPSSKPGSRYISTGWSDVNNNFWLYGGWGTSAMNGGFLNDLWKYNLTTKEWTWMNGDSLTAQFGKYGIKNNSSPLNKPGARINAISWSNNSPDFYLFGGNGFAETTIGKLNDLWKYNSLINEWIWINGDSTINNFGSYGVKGIYNTTNKPSARETTVSWVDTLGNLWLFGGHLNSNYLNDLWKYNKQTNMWVWMSGDNIPNQPTIYGTKGIGATNNKPGSRRESSQWVDKLGNLWLLGGGTSTFAYNDLWRYTVCYPSKTAISVSSYTVCSANTVTLNASGANTYTWSNGINGPLIVVSPTLNTNYYVNGTDVNNCVDPSVVTISVTPLPTVNITASSYTSCTSATNSFSIALSGQPYGGLYSGFGISDSTFNIQSSAGIYTISYSYTQPATGCQNNSVLSITVTSCVGVNEYDIENHLIKVFPNPFHNNLIIEYLREDIKKINIEIKDVLGRTIFLETIKLAENKCTVGLQNLEDGVYFIETSINGIPIGRSKILKQ